MLAAFSGESTDNQRTEKRRQEVMEVDFFLYFHVFSVEKRGQGAEREGKKPNKQIGERNKLLTIVVGILEYLCFYINTSSRAFFVLGVDRVSFLKVACSICRETSAAKRKMKQFRDLFFVVSRPLSRKASATKKPHLCAKSRLCVVLYINLRRVIPCFFILVFSPSGRVLMPALFIGEMDRRHGQSRESRCCRYGRKGFLHNAGSVVPVPDIVPVPDMVPVESLGTDGIRPVWCARWCTE